MSLREGFAEGLYRIRRTHCEVPTCPRLGLAIQTEMRTSRDEGDVTAIGLTIWKSAECVSSLLQKYSLDLYRVRIVFCCWFVVLFFCLDYLLISWNSMIFLSEPMSLCTYYASSSDVQSE